MDLAPAVLRATGGSGPVVVTALEVSKGLLWVGTNAGVTLSLPLPRLQGVPLIQGRPSVSYHGHTAPITFLMTLAAPEHFLASLQTSGSQEQGDKPSRSPIGSRKISEPANVSAARRKEEEKREGSSGFNNGEQKEEERHGGGAKRGTSLDGVLSPVGTLRKSSTLPRSFAAGIGEEELRSFGGELGDVGSDGSEDGEVLGLCR